MTNNNNHEMDFDEAIKFMDKKSEEVIKVTKILKRMDGFEDIVLSGEELKLLWSSAITCEEDVSFLKERKDCSLNQKAELKLQLNEYKKDFCSCAEKIKKYNPRFVVMVELVNQALTNKLMSEIIKNEINVINYDIELCEGIENIQKMIANNNRGN